ncbi:MAG: carbohydrate ABC transporter permease [Oscillospiraceae bacterium]
MKGNTNKKNRIKTDSATIDVVIIFISLIICMITIYPMYYVVIKSISDPQLSLTNPVSFYPQGFYLGSYKLIVQDAMMWKAYANTIFYTICGTLLMLINSVLCAYPLISSNLAGRKWVVRYLLVPMYFSGGMIPTFLLIQKLGLYDTRLAVILPTAVGIMNVILTRTYFMTIPAEISESASIDGASHFQILLRIYLPLAKPILAVVAIYTIVSIWNSYFNAMMYLPNKHLHPLQMYLQRILISQTVDLTELKTAEQVQEAQQKVLGATQLKYAMIVFVTLPIIFVYPLFQKHFMKGVMLGSLKG